MCPECLYGFRRGDGLDRHLAYGRCRSGSGNVVRDNER